MGKKSKGRVPIKGGSKKVRQIKNVQEGGRNIGSDRKMDVDMTNLLHFFKDLVTKTTKDELEKEVGASRAPTRPAEAMDELKDFLATLFYILGGRSDIILLRDGGTLKLTPAGGEPESTFSQDYANSYRTAMDKLGFVMRTVVQTDNGGKLKIAKLKPAAAAAAADETLPRFSLTNAKTQIKFKYDDQDIDIDLGVVPGAVVRPSGTAAAADGTITISADMQKVLGIPREEKSIGVLDENVHEDIFNEHRLPILHHILNLRIHIANTEEGDGKLSNFFVDEDKDEDSERFAKTMCENSRAKGRVLNATGYHIRKAERLTRYKEEDNITFAKLSPTPADAGDADSLYAEGETEKKLLKLFMPRGNTASDRTAAASALGGVP